MNEETGSLFRATCITATVYAVLFLAHIVAAASGWNTVFRAVALLITLLTFSVGICIRVLAGLNQKKDKQRGTITGICFGIPLAAGLAWAYAEQSFDPMLTFAFIALTLTVHFIDRAVYMRDTV